MPELCPAPAGPTRLPRRSGPATVRVVIDRPNVVVRAAVVIATIVVLAPDPD
jgi:hypothetical protein